MSGGGRLLQKAVLQALYWSHLHLIAAPFTRGRGAVLMFHHVRPAQEGRLGGNAGLDVTPEFLAAVIERVQVKGIDLVSLDEALRRLRLPDARRFCAVTFDDGYRDNLEFAYPVLKAAGCPFTVYVATGLIDGTAELWWDVVERVVERQEAIAFSLDGPVEYLECRTRSAKLAAFERIMAALRLVDEDRQRQAVRELAWKYGVDVKALSASEMMGWDEIRSLAEDPLVTIGGHTVGHYALAKLPEARARAEMRDGAKVLEAVLGRPVKHFAFPYGYAAAAGEREFRLTAELGFATAVTTRPGVLFASAAETPTAWPRVSINGHFQSVPYLDVFLSGAPQALYGLLGSAARGTAPSRLRAVASSG